MKALILAMVMAFLVMFSGVQAAEFPILDRQIESRVAHLEWLVEVRDVSMQANIDYITEIGGTTTELETLRSELDSQLDTARTLTTHVGLNNLVKDMATTVTSFREETLDQITANGGSVAVLVQRVITALTDNKAALDQLKEDYWTVHKANGMWIFDTRVERAQLVLDELADDGYDITDAQAKLDEINGWRDDLELAYDGQNNAAVLVTSLNIFDLSKELIQILKDMQIEVPEKSRVRFWINVGDRAVERSGTVISELKTVGLDVTTLEPIHDKARLDLKKAKDFFNNDDLEGAKASLRDLIQDFKDLVEAYKNLVFGEDPPPNLVIAVNNLIQTLEEAIQGMEDDFPA